MLGHRRVESTNELSGSAVTRERPCALSLIPHFRSPLRDGTRWASKPPRAAREARALCAIDRGLQKAGRAGREKGSHRR